MVSGGGCHIAMPGKKPTAKPVTTKSKGYGILTRSERELTITTMKSMKGSRVSSVIVLLSRIKQDRLN